MNHYRGSWLSCVSLSIISNNKHNHCMYYRIHGFDQLPYTVNDESLEWLKFGESGSQTFWWIKVWRIYHEVNKRLGLIVSWRMKVWQILSIRQIRQTLATQNFHRLQYYIILSTIFTQFVVYIQIVVQCITIQVQITLFLWLILIVAHPQIVSHMQIFRSKLW